MDMASLQKQYRLLHDLYLLMDYGDSLILEKFQLTNAQLNILSLLDETEGKRLTEISQAIFRSKSTITRAVDQMEERGLVKRNSDYEDRRAQQLILTPEGREFYENAHKLLFESVRERFRLLEEQELKELFEITSKLRDGLLNHYRAG
jgi:DNA-binding MarR family transcriptional regulator